MPKNNKNKRQYTIVAYRDEPGEPWENVVANLEIKNATISTVYNKNFGTVAIVTDALAGQPIFDNDKAADKWIQSHPSSKYIKILDSDNI